MTTSASSELIAELDAAMKTGSPERRGRILQCIVDLFVAGADRLHPSQIRIFDDVLVALVERADARTLPQLSASLAGLTIAPVEAVHRLACHENAAVAAPLLLKSPALSDASLLELASHRGQQHVLAISGRQSLSEALTDTILKHAGRDACRALARNAGARFSEQGYATLLAAAERDDVVAEALGLRTELPAEMLEHLLSKTTKTVHARLLKAAPPHMRDGLQAAVDALTAEAGTTPPGPVNYSDALAMVDALNRIGKLNDSAVNGYAIRGERTNVVASLHLLSGAALETIEQLMEQGGSTGLIVACRAARLHWQTTQAVINSGRKPPLTKEQIEQGKALFETLYVSAAQYTIRFEPPVGPAVMSGAPPAAARASR